MPVIYNGSKLIPVQSVDIKKSFNKTGAGEIIGQTYQIIVNGTLVAYKGSPDSDGDFWTASNYPPDEAISHNSRLASILRKQEAIRELFATEGAMFEVQPFDGTSSVRGNVRVIDISFAPGPWIDTCPYTINLEADVLYPVEENIFNIKVSDASESWTIDTEEQPENATIPQIYRLSHSVSAVGKRFYDNTGTLTKQSWEQARDYVLNRLGFDSTIALSSGVHNLPSYYSGWNHTRSSNIDEAGGSFSVTENWIMTSGSAIENFTVESVKDQSTGLDKVSINGDITGLEVRDSNLLLTTHKYTNAVSKFNTASGLAFSRAQTYSGFTLNIIPMLERVARNPAAGTISYSFDFDNRPSNIVSGARSEVISINDNLTVQQIAIVGVLGRAAGPVLQDLNTTEPLACNLSIELVMPRPDFGTNTLANLQSAFFAQRPTIACSSIINAADPANRGYSESYRTQDQENWSPKDGRYSRNITWIMEL